MMNPHTVDSLHAQLAYRQQALVTTMEEVGSARDLVRLLVQVDQALERLGTDAFGKCQACGGEFTEEELLEQPMNQYCLCRLTERQQEALQRDLDLAWKIQASLLPNADLVHAGWRAHYRFQPAGPVSGDYCDMLQQEADGGWLYFLVGDVSGKGVAASYLMAHVSALVRRTLDEPIPLCELVRVVNRHLSERSPATHFVTLICGRAHVSGRVEICNAGHCMPLVVRQNAVERLDSTGMPVGISTESEYTTHTTHVGEGDSLILYTDGLSEAHNVNQDLYGEESLVQVVAANGSASPRCLAARCLRDLETFRGAAPPTDDLTLMILRRL